MKSYYLINYKDTDILVLDMSQLSENDIFKLLKGSKSFIYNQPKNSVLTLINITNLNYSKKTLNAFKEYVTDTKKYVLASAIYGASFFQSMAIETFAKSNLIPIKICRNELEAKNWLLSMS